MRWGHAMSSFKHQAGPELLSIGEVARLLTVSTRSVWRMRRERRMPSPIKLRGSVRWRLDDLRQWMAEGCPAQTAKTEGDLK